LTSLQQIENADQQQIASLTSQLATAQKTASDAQTQINSLTSQLATVQKTASDAQTQLATVQKTASDAQTQINTLNSQISTNTSIQSSQTAKLNDLNSQVANDSSIKITQAAQITNLTKEIAAGKSEWAAQQSINYTSISDENDMIQQKISDMTSDFSTYEQKVVYQQQQLDNLMTVNFWMWITYYFKVCMFMYYLFGVNTDMFMSTKIVLTLLAIIYPYVINIVEDYGYDIWKYSWSVINVDVYSQDR
jgi:hypothetical protein